MLSGETSVGDHPLDSVRVMDSIACDVEQSGFLKQRDVAKIDALAGPLHTVARCAVQAAQEGDRPLVVFTWSGRSAILASKGRVHTPIFALTPDSRIADMLSLVWGITALTMPIFDTTGEMIAAGERALVHSGLLPAGSQVVILAGNTPMRGATNLMTVETLNGT